MQSVDGVIGTGGDGMKAVRRKPTTTPKVLAHHINYQDQRNTHTR